MPNSLNLKNSFGPLSDLIGVWEGDQGDDLAPSDDRGTENNLYRERMTFEDAGFVENHEQKIFALRYTTQVRRLGEEKILHEEMGYWTWEPSTGQVLRCFSIPRGISLIAGGMVQEGAKSFTLRAERGSESLGICSNPFLVTEFKMLSFEFNLNWLDQNSFSYNQDTVIQLPSQTEVFHHRDKNRMKRV